MYQHYVASPKTLGLRTNAPGVKWSWGVNMPSATPAEYEECALRVRYTVHDQTPPAPGPETPGFGKFHYFFGPHQGDELYYQRTFMGRRDLWMRVSGLLSDEIHVEVNREYARYVTHRFMNLHSAGYVLTDIVAWALTQRGLAPVHCSAFSKNDATVLVLAPPNSGKTLTTMRACLDMGAAFLAEDVAISDGAQLFAVPWTSTFRYYESIDRSLRTKALNALTQVFPPAELIPVKKSSRIDDLLSSAQILDHSRVTHVAILERHEAEGVEAVDVTTAAEKAKILNRFEFNYVKSPLMVAYEYFNPGLNVEEALVQEGLTLTKVLQQAEECFVVRTRDATRYAELILEYVA